MKIKNFCINSSEEVVVKIVKEVLTLFKIDIMKEEEAANEADYERLAVENLMIGATRSCVLTKMILTQKNGSEEMFTKEARMRDDEKAQAGLRRLIKKNLYDILLRALTARPAPWGILHGVRPTKIVHKYIERGFARAEILARLQEDYAVALPKAELIVDLAFRQRPFLAMTDDKTVSVYIGIPFCLSRCLYCSFPSYVLPEDKVLQAFWTALKKDLLAAKRVVDTHRLRVQNIYIGGGTPTSLPSALFEEFLALAESSFYQPGTVEFTVEAGRPDSVDDAKIKAMLAHHVSRVSVNPQSMQEKTLKHIGRNHTVRDIIELFEHFRQSGMKNINMDLILGLPGETADDVEDTMRQIVSLRPDDITLHALALKRGSALKRNPGDYALPDDETAARMFAIAMRYVGEAGFLPYYLYRQGYMSGNLENVGCCRPGAEGLYNIQIMEEQQTIIGIGPAATTKVVDPAARSLQTAFNAKDLTTYLQCVDKYIEKRTDLLHRAFTK